MYPVEVCIYVLIVFVLSTCTSAHPLAADVQSGTINLTITAPAGTSQHGDPNLLCTPTKWSDLVLFYLINYASHAATVKTIPGENALSILVSIAYALLFPYSGVSRGLEAIFHHGNFIRDDLKRAVRCGALCMVIRSQKWRPLPNQRIEGAVVTDADLRVRGSQTYQPTDNSDATESLLSRDQTHLMNIELQETRQTGNSSNSEAVALKTFIPMELDDESGHTVVVTRNLHGLQSLGEEYALLRLPHNAVVVPNVEDKGLKIELCSVQNIAQGVVAIAQVSFSGVTLFRSRGDQVARFGYASFGLTVLPYLIMSLINLAGVSLTPDYPKMYLVSSPELEEARERGLQVDGTIGAIVPMDLDVSNTNLVSGEFLNLGDDLVFDALPSKIASRSEDKPVRPLPTSGSVTEEPDSQENNDSGSFRSRLSVAQLEPDNHDYSSRPASPIPSNPIRYNILPKSTEEEPVSTMEAALYIPACGRIELTEQVRFHHDISSYSVIFTLLIGAVPYIVISVLTHFHVAHSTVPQRILTMFWLGLGTFVLPLLNWIRDAQAVRNDIRDLSESQRDKIARDVRFSAWKIEGYGNAEDDPIESTLLAAILAFLCAVPLGGFVVVGQMLMSYGNCQRLD